jgi:hypothetical protein
MYTVRRKGIGPGAIPANRSAMAALRILLCAQTCRQCGYVEVVMVRNQRRTPSNRLCTTRHVIPVSAAALVDACRIESRELLIAHAHIVQALAAELQIARTMDGAAIDSAIERAVSAKAISDKIERCARWAGVEKSAADFTPEPTEQDISFSVDSRNPDVNMPIMETNSAVRWTDDTERRLLELKAQVKSFRHIASTMKRSPSAVE